MDGAIGTVKHWNKALTAVEIMKDFQGTTQAQEVTDLLISSWDMNGDVLDDVSSHDGTLVNQAYLDPQYSQLTKLAHLAYVAAGDDWAFMSMGGQPFILHIEGV